MGNGADGPIAQMKGPLGPENLLNACPGYIPQWSLHQSGRYAVAARSVTSPSRNSCIEPLPVDGRGTQAAERVLLIGSWYAAAFGPLRCVDLSTLLLRGATVVQARTWPAVPPAVRVKVCPTVCRPSGGHCW